MAKRQNKNKNPPAKQVALSLPLKGDKFTVHPSSRYCCFFFLETSGLQTSISFKPYFFYFPCSIFISLPPVLQFGHYYQISDNSPF